MPKESSSDNKLNIEPYTTSDRPRKPLQSNKEKESINHKQTGALVADQNSFKGVVLKYA